MSDQEPKAMPEALETIRRAYAREIAGGATVTPDFDGAGITVEGPGMRGAVTYRVPLTSDDTGHWSK